MDLLALVFTLRPLPAAAAAEGDAPRWWGRAAHALLLRVVQEADAAMAEALHQGDGPRPFTASTLMGRFPGHRLDAEGVYTLRFTSLRLGLSALLAAAAAAGGPLAAGAAIDLDQLPFQVQEVIADGHPWAGQDGYAALAAASLTDPGPRRISLQLASPTTFKSGGRHVPFPQPELVFGSLLERWNSFAPLAFPDETRRYAAECLAVSRYRLTTRPVSLKGGGLRVGAVGDVTYTTLVYDRYWMNVLQVLAAFARYAGVGAGASMGLGQCRLAAKT